MIRLPRRFPERNHFFWIKERKMKSQCVLIRAKRVGWIKADGCHSKPFVDALNRFQYVGRSFSLIVWLPHNDFDVFSFLPRARTLLPSLPMYIIATTGNGCFPIYWCVRLPSQSISQLVVIIVYIRLRVITEWMNGICTMKNLWTRPHLAIIQHVLLHCWWWKSTPADRCTFSAHCHNVRAFEPMFVLSCLCLAFGYVHRL